MHDIVYDDILCIISCNYTFQSGCVTPMHADVCMQMVMCISSSARCSYSTNYAAWPDAVL